MRYKKNWEQTQEKWRNYWNHCNTGRPLMCVIARKPGVGDPVLEKEKEYGGTTGILCQGNFYDLPEELKIKDTFDQYRSAEGLVARYRHFCRQHEFMGESFPNLDIDFGPGSLAAYLGCDVGFNEHTVWTTPCWTEDEDMEAQPRLRFDPENKWFKEHIQLARDCARLAKGDFLVAMPDLMEGMDALAQLRGPTNLLMDFLEDPELVDSRLQELDALYYDYFDRFHEAIRSEDGSNAYTVFQIWGPGKTVKVQCDISAMTSTAIVEEFAVPYLKKQTEKADCVLFHLDGKECIRHLDAILSIEGIDALQWTSGDVGPDGTYPQWDEIYEKALKAGKSIWIKVYSGEFEDWIRNTDRIVQKFGSHSLFLHFPEMSYEQAQELLAYAEEHWSDVKGSFFA